MPTVTTPIANDNLLFVQCYGVVTLQDLMDWRVDDRVSPDCKGRLVTLVDLSGVTETDLNFEQLNVIHGRLARHYATLALTLRLVLFAPNDLSFGMARIIQSLSAEAAFLDVEIFRTEAKASFHLPAGSGTLAHYRNLSESHHARLIS
ncbi:hypothetical protein N6L24_04245 [Cognatishimia sp. SS12]|uniref:hypothetical protein n=1 Tax=Cognatishimia sp. SS12 TaxID=2979465 RepID=UPI002330EACC|nr:hypothetical protein [Cognatishimia sp. SS12]MDC0737475.1 hypothetical protein [Cognatishimia sp. SS12]